MTVHSEHQHILSSLEQHGYNAMDGCSKVMYLGIKTSRLDNIKAMILSSKECHADFDTCITTYKGFVKQPDGQLGLRIDAVHVSGEKLNGSESGVGVVTFKNITGQYYKKDGKKTLYHTEAERFDESPVMSQKEKIFALKSKMLHLKPKL